jgi:hypothetical protein
MEVTGESEAGAQILMGLSTIPTEAREEVQEPAQPRSWWRRVFGT